MKMITAIVNKEDANAVCNALTKGGFSVTKLSTTGGFLMAGNMTLLIGNDGLSAGSDCGRRDGVRHQRGTL